MGQMMSDVVQDSQGSLFLPKRPTVTLGDQAGGPDHGPMQRPRAARARETHGKSCGTCGGVGLADPVLAAPHVRVFVLSKGLLGAQLALRLLEPQSHIVTPREGNRRNQGTLHFSVILEHSILSLLHFWCFFIPCDNVRGLFPSIPHLHLAILITLFISQGAVSEGGGAGAEFVSQKHLSWCVRNLGSSSFNTKGLRWHLGALLGSTLKFQTNTVGRHPLAQYDALFSSLA